MTTTGEPHHEADDVETDGRLIRGRRTRATVLAAAADIASTDGLDGVSIGRLASDLGFSKAGIFSHFGSKEELQIATVRAAAETFAREVIEPALEAPPGLRRIWALCDEWLSYASRKVFPGGCFFLAASAEFDARPGRVRNELAATRRLWLEVHAATIRDAQDLEELDGGVDPEQLAFELDALAMAADLHAQLCDDTGAYRTARQAIWARLSDAALDATALPNEP